MQTGKQRAIAALVPAAFVFLWSTGFIGVRLGAPYAEPLTFLSLRFIVVLAVLLPFVAIRRVRLPAPRQAAHVAAVGLMVHALYLGGVFIAIGHGMPAGLAALIVSLQPLLTAALVGPVLGERVGRRQLVGLLLGLLGVILVLSEKLAPAGSGALFGAFDYWAVVFCCVSLCAMTLGVIYQKRYCSNVDLWGGAVIQYLAAFALAGGAALVFEDFQVEWTGQFLFAIGWLSLVLSVGAVSLLMLLIRRGEAGRTASLFYLVPPTTAVMAFLLFDERLGPTALIGMVVAAVGVALVVATKREVTARPLPESGELP